jgi:hypothetical protein
VQKPERPASDVQRAALSAVWDRVDMARRFIELARKGGTQDVKLSWCLYTAASGIWSAVNIFTEKYLGDPPRTSDWFEQQGHPLVNQIRHGGVHHRKGAARGIGVTETLGPDAAVEWDYFLILGDDLTSRIPLSEAISELDAASSLVEAHVLDVTGTRYFSFNP